MEAELCATVTASLSSGIYEPRGHLDLFKKPPVHVGTFPEVVVWRPEHQLSADLCVPPPSDRLILDINTPPHSHKDPPLIGLLIFHFPDINY